MITKFWILVVRKCNIDKCNFVEISLCEVFKIFSFCEANFESDDQNQTVC